MALAERSGERRACRVVGQPRSTQRLPVPAPSDHELALRAFLGISRDHIPTGAGREPRKWPGTPAGSSTTSASTGLCREEGKLCPTARESAFGGIHVAVDNTCPIAPNVIWALYFLFVLISGGTILKLLNVIYEYSHECPAIVIDRSIDADGYPGPCRSSSALQPPLLTRATQGHH